MDAISRNFAMKAISGGAALAMLLAFATGPHAVSAQAPAVPVPTVWDKLGVPQAFKGLKKVKDHLTNAHGNHPGMEAKPPLKSLADAANLESDNPAIKKAAEIKQEEDKAAQKIKAIKYLAKIGCGCYDRDGSITEALLAATDDCTESVRLATVKAIGKAAKSGQCDNCDQKNCCGDDIVKRLNKMAYETDDQGCSIEPSERVREAAAEALRICYSGRGPIEAPVDQREVPVEEEERELPLDGGPPPADGSAGHEAPLPRRSSRRIAAKYDWTSAFDTASVSAVTIDDRRTKPNVRYLPPVWQTNTADARFVARSPQSAQFRQVDSAPRRRALPNMPRGGTVQSVDLSNATALIRLDTDGRLPAGTGVRIFHKYVTGRAAVGELEVLTSRSGHVVARPVGQTKLRKIAYGDEAVVVSYNNM